MEKATLQTVATDVRAIARSVRVIANQKPLSAKILSFTAAPRPDLAKGEAYAGIILAKKGGQDHHLIKLPGEMPDKDGWDAANKWAKDVKESLPTRREQALMYANIPEKFKTDSPYWSSEESADASSYAWYQWFDHGNQLHWDKGTKCRACLVRRVPI